METAAHLFLHRPIAQQFWQLLAGNRPSHGHNPVNYLLARRKTRSGPDIKRWDRIYMGIIWHLYGKRGIDGFSKINQEAYGILSNLL
jgi:hypothetical protein